MTDTLIDGVSTHTATTTELDSYLVTEQQLNNVAVPQLFNASNPHERIFFAFGDGTGNDAINNPDEMTNVGRLYNEVKTLSKSESHIGVGYSAGVGTQDGLPGILDSTTGATYEQRLESLYDQLGEQTAIWKAEDPDAVVRVVYVAFSRAAAPAGTFTQMVDERGIQDPANKVVSYVADPLHPGQTQTVVSYTGAALQDEYTTANQWGQTPLKS